MYTEYPHKVVSSIFRKRKMCTREKISIEYWRVTFNRKHTKLFVLAVFRLVSVQNILFVLVLDTMEPLVCCVWYAKHLKIHFMSTTVLLGTFSTFYSRKFLISVRFEFEWRFIDFQSIIVKARENSENLLHSRIRWIWKQLWTLLWALFS